MSADFGWSYPPGCSGPPDYPDEPDHYECPHCKFTIDLTNPRYEAYEEWIRVDEEFSHIEVNVWDKRPHRLHKSGEYAEVLHDVGTFVYYTCPNCKVESRDDYLIANYDYEEEEDDEDVVDDSTDWYNALNYRLGD